MVAEHQHQHEPAELVLGPLLRYAGTESASFWVETSAPCEVEILGRRTPTFTVERHHFALVLVDDLQPGSVVAYEVRLNGRRVWPLDDGRPPCVVHTRRHERQVRLVFGSCRIGDPQPTSTEPPWPDELKRTGIDALRTYSCQLQRSELEWPDALLLLGDQVYADEVSPWDATPADPLSRTTDRAPSHARDAGVRARVSRHPPARPLEQASGHRRAPDLHGPPL